MDIVEQALGKWGSSLPKEISVGGLMARNPTAHKWKSPFRSLILREVLFWRLHDLLVQSYMLHKQGHMLGARVLLRSGFETLAVLIYLNQITASVIDGSMNFHAFSDRTSELLLGSRNCTTSLKSINIMTILKKCEKSYIGIVKAYEDLSESAHPNCEGILMGYSKSDHNEYVTTFSNRWGEMYSSEHKDDILICMQLFETEYSLVWAPQFEKLESWIEANDAELEATKGKEKT